VNPKARLGMALALVALLAAVPTFAFNYPLSEEAIREAYFLGKADGAKRATFLAKYVHPLPMPDSGPYVSEIGLDTPFTQIAERAASAYNYHAPDAVEEFQNKPLCFRVRVDITLTSGYWPVPQSAYSSPYYQWVPDFWNDLALLTSSLRR